MPWFFQNANDMAPVLNADDAQAIAASDGIVETPYTGCAFCGDGDGEGCCPTCMAGIFAQSAARAATRRGE